MTATGSFQMVLHVGARGRMPEPVSALRVEAVPQVGVASVSKGIDEGELPLRGPASREGERLRVGVDQDCARVLDHD